MATQQEKLYYQEELRYLKDAGARFASRHADIGQYLGLTADDPSLKDPHTERIIEAFAFLTGRLRRFLDGQYSQLTHGLFNLIYPHYLRPLPSKCIVAFTPEVSMLDKPLPIPKQTVLQTRETADGHYRFVTTQAVTVQPIRIQKVHVDPEIGRDFSISIALKTDPGFTLGQCDLDALEFYIHGDPRDRFELFQHLSDPNTRIGIKNMPSTTPLSIVWSGFQTDHLLTPEDPGDFAMTHALRDYFDFPERFGFFRIKGLQELVQSSTDANLNSDADAFQIDFFLTRAFTQGTVFANDNIQLFCSPVVNLSKVDCEPFKVDTNHFEFPLVPDLRRPWMQIHHLRNVHAFHDEKGIVEVGPYFRMTGLADKHFYTIRREQTHDGWRTYLRFLDMEDSSPTPLSGWEISSSAWCSDGSRAQSLGVGQVSEIPPGQLPETVQAKNITQTTLAFWPPLSEPGEWRFLATLAHSFSDVSESGRLKTLLELYNHPKTDWCNRKINGIIDINQEKAHRIYHGLPIAGRNLNLICEPSQFQHMGDLALFAKVFGYFLQGYCPMNEFIHLRVAARNTESVFTHEAIG